VSAPGERRPSRGRVGMVCLIMTESAFFTIFVVAYLYYVGRSLSGPTPAEVLRLPILGTACLFGSSATIALAVAGLRAGAERRFRLWWAVTVLLGAGFLATTAAEWTRLIGTDGLTIGTNLFGTSFYSLVGFHAGHVAVGVILMGLVLVLALRGLVTAAEAERVEVLSWYWHFVDGVWAVVLTVVYVIGR
jgi:cytochrome c oxidase subunit 3